MSCNDDIILYNSMLDVSHLEKADVDTIILNLQSLGYTQSYGFDGGHTYAIEYRKGGKFALYKYMKYSQLNFSIGAGKSLGRFLDSIDEIEGRTPTAKIENGSAILGEIGEVIFFEMAADRFAYNTFLSECEFVDHYGEDDGSHKLLVKVNEIGKLPKMVKFKIEVVEIDGVEV